jgi:hypothetical protein
LSAETPVIWRCMSRAARKAPMDHDSLRLLIRSKLEHGLLPYNSIPRIWGAPSDGETCDGCDLMIDPKDLVIEGISLSDVNKALSAYDRRRPLQLHVECFYLWDGERRK